MQLIGHIIEIVMVTLLFQSLMLCQVLVNAFLCSTCILLRSSIILSYLILVMLYAFVCSRKRVESKLYLRVCSEKEHQLIALTLSCRSMGHFPGSMHVVILSKCL